MSESLETASHGRGIGPRSPEARPTRIALARTGLAAERRARRRRTLMVLPMAIAPVLFFSVREVSRSEKILAGDEAHAGRVVTYLLEPGQLVRLPIEANAEVLRIVAHVFATEALAPGPHRIRLSTELRGSRITRQETIELSLPGTALRALAEDGSMTIGDPIAVNIDTHDSGGGELQLTLDSASDAAGLLVRAYRRESIGPLDALHRRASLRETKREHLARRAGALGWLDLDSSDRRTLVAARWRRVAPLPESERGVPFRAIVLTPRPTAAAERLDGTLGNFLLRPDERLAGVASGPNRIAVRAPGDSSARLLMHARSDRGGERSVEGTGALELELGAGEHLEFELGTERTAKIALDAADESRVTLASLVGYFRASAERPVVVTADASPLVLLVSARRPVPRMLEGPVSISCVAAVEKASGELVSSVLEALVARSRIDRYDGSNDDFAPSERAVFHVLVPAGGRATFVPNAGPLDLVLSELDPRAPPRPLEPRMEPSTPPSAARTESWHGFVPRQPSNASAFELEGRSRVRVAPRLGPDAASSAPQQFAVVRVARPQTGVTLRRGGRRFAQADASFTLHVPADRAVALPIRFFAEHPTSVLVQIDHGHPRRRSAGTARRITTDRTIRIEGETATTLVLGDDLASGPHELSFVAEPSRVLWVHLPWIRRATRPQQSAWISGDFEP